MQGELFEEPEPSSRFDSIGKSTVAYRDVKSILTPASGFVGAYDYTLNPYSGCTFGCVLLCSVLRPKQGETGWLGQLGYGKENALRLLSKEPHGSLDGKTIYMSSVTDPYQPVEKKLGLTRSLLEWLVAHHAPRLVIQTRSPLVTRDIDLIARLPASQINMTVTTDSEEVRQIFEPHCPSNTVRLKAIQTIQRAGLNGCITLTPLLPISDPHAFAQNLLETGIQKFVVQPFHATRGRFVAGTRNQAIDITRRMNWNHERYLEVLSILKQYIPDLGEGKEGFKPV
ncbi:MAG: radical SAM protein [Rhodothermales bacterium]